MPKAPAHPVTMAACTPGAILPGSTSTKSSLPESSWGYLRPHFAFKLPIHFLFMSYSCPQRPLKNLNPPLQGALGELEALPLSEDSTVSPAISSGADSGASIESIEAVFGFRSSKIACTWGF